MGARGNVVVEALSYMPESVKAHKEMKITEKRLLCKGTDSEVGQWCPLSHILFNVQLDKIVKIAEKLDKTVL
jgi:hypothetical protein